MKIFDVNGNGLLSLAELDKGLKEMGQIMEPIYKAKKPVMQAYQKAKSYYKGNDDYVSLKELKYFFIFLYQYFDYYLAFKSIDSNFDDRVSIKEFRALGPYLKQFVLFLSRE